MTSDQPKTGKPDQSDGAEGATARRGPNLLIALPVILFVALAIVFGLSLKSSDPSRLPSALIGKPAPAADFAALEGIQTDGKPAPGITSASLRAGEVTVVNLMGERRKVAPEGGEALYVLVHTPYLRDHHDWTKMLPDYRRTILEKLKSTAGLHDLEDQIVSE